jgi:hypothetical protein
MPVAHIHILFYWISNVLAPALQYVSLSFEETHAVQLTVG